MINWSSTGRRCSSARHERDVSNPFPVVGRRAASQELLLLVDGTHVMSVVRPIPLEEPAVSTLSEVTTRSVGQ
jgi:hypothetical protein